MMRMTKEEIMTIVTFLLKMMLALIIIMIGLKIFFDDIDYDDDGGDDDEVRETGEVLMSCPTSKETRNRHNSSDPPTPPHRISSPVVPHFVG